MRLGILLFILLMASQSVRAIPFTQEVEYLHEEALLEGYLAYDDTSESQRPGILVVHDWTGIGSFVRDRVDKLAQMGYIVFAVDIYGKGVRPQSSQEAGAEAGKYKADRELLRGRVLAGLGVLQKHPLTDPRRIAAIGYCFGGTTVLELARSGADIAGVVSFHGNLDTPNPEDARNIKAKVLVLHGADDPLVSSEEIAVFQEEMRSAGVDWQMVFYGDAVHSFTKPAAGDNKASGSAYHEKADRRSWEAMKQFFAEIFL